MESLRTDEEQTSGDETNWLLLPPPLTQFENNDIAFKDYRFSFIYSSIETVWGFSYALLGYIIISSWIGKQKRQALETSEQALMIFLAENPVPTEQLKGCEVAEGCSAKVIFDALFLAHVSWCLKK